MLKGIRWSLGSSVFISEAAAVFWEVRWNIFIDIHVQVWVKSVVHWYIWICLISLVETDKKLLEKTPRTPFDFPSTLD